MRRQRIAMVQTVDQYMLCHRSVSCYEQDIQLNETGVDFGTTACSKFFAESAVHVRYLAWTTDQALIFERLVRHSKCTFEEQF